MLKNWKMKQSEYSLLVAISQRAWNRKNDDRSLITRLCRTELVPCELPPVPVRSQKLSNSTLLPRLESRLFIKSPGFAVVCPLPWFLLLALWVLSGTGRKTILQLWRRILLIRLSRAGLLRGLVWREKSEVWKISLPSGRYSKGCSDLRFSRWTPMGYKHDLNLWIFLNLENHLDSGLENSSSFQFYQARLWINSHNQSINTYV